MDLLIFYSRFSIISLSSFPSATQYSPILFLFPSSLLIYSLPIREYEPPPISSLPSLISFTEFFFPPFVHSLLSILSQSRLSTWVSRLWVSVLSWVTDSLFVVLRVVDSLFYLWRFHRFTVSLKVSSIHSTSTAYR